MKKFFYIFFLLIISNLNSKLLCNLELSVSNRRVCIIGSGYVGLVTGACFADLNHFVTCIDIDESKIKRLRNNDIPIYEKDLDEIVRKTIKSNNLNFSSEIKSSINESDILFICVGTPTKNGESDLSAIYSVINVIIDSIKQNQSKKIICIKSTVPVGTCKMLYNYLLDNGLMPNQFSIVSNPEFLREGTAVYDFSHPDRIVIGSNDYNAALEIQDLYKSIIEEKKVPCLITDLQTSESIKYASNAFLALKVAFINEIAELCDYTNANISDVVKGVGLDKRITHSFLNPGPGFGGSCFPKDVEALASIVKKYNISCKIINSILESNNSHKKYIASKIDPLLKNNATVCLLGLTFKANTDDIRYSPSIDIIEYLQTKNVNIQAYDPKGMENMNKLFPDIKYCKSAYEAAYNSDVVVVLTEWEEFKNLDLEKLSQIMNNKCIIDYRDILDINNINKNNFEYYAIGKPRRIF